MYVEAIFQILGAGLSIWNNIEQRKYVDKFIKLKREYYEESNKPADQRSDAVLDHVLFELRLLGAAFAAGVGKPDTQNKP